MRSIICTLTVICGLILTTATHAGDGPSPKAEWWKDLSGKEKAVFEMDTGAMKMKQVYTIVKVEGPVITYSVAMEVNGNLMPGQEQTVDYTPKEDAGEPVEGEVKVTTKKLGEEKVKAGDTTLDCTIWEVKTDASTSKLWHSQQLPPVFNGGSAKSVIEANGQTTTITLLEYSK